MSKVRIDTVCIENRMARRDIRYETRVYVDDQLIGVGSYGGEPEDNSIYRDYSWVEQLLEETAVQLGAEVERTKSTEQEE